MSMVAVITARGGSKRIPRKNIKNFCGKPIIAYSIEAALNSKLFNEVMVSTDDNEIAEVAKKYGAEVPFMRSEKNSDDYATTAIQNAGKILNICVAFILQHLLLLQKNCNALLICLKKKMPMK